MPGKEREHLRSLLLRIALLLLDAVEARLWTVAVQLRLLALLFAVHRHLYHFVRVALGVRMLVLDLKKNAHAA